jgi:peptidyl-prolyl cis-trans isomerase D
MQIIQSIQKNRYLLAGTIALAIIAFIITSDDKSSKNLNSSTIGKVNGTKIELSSFNKRVKDAEDQEAQRTGQRPTTARSNQIREQMWNQIVAEDIFYKETEKLGITFTPKEMSAILLSNDQNNPLLQEQGMTDPATGKLDISKAQEAITSIKKLKGEDKERVDAQLTDPLILSSLVSKYGSLIAASAYYPTWMQQKEATEAKDFASISYVGIGYSEISDSAVKVTDTDINDYVQKHKKLFKQEAGRRISYVSFSQLPNGDDSTRIKEVIAQLKPTFALDTNAKAFVARNATETPFQDEYLPKSKIKTSALNTILTQPMGTVYGPYADNGNFVIAKVLGSKQLPDSVKARHILIATVNPQTGQPIMEDSLAKKLADSIYTAIKGGANFAELAAKYSADGSKDKGGDLGTFEYGKMVPEFNEFVFTKPVGSMDVVKTQFGYHVIDIENQKDFKPAYKIAFLSKQITPSDITINNASLAATKASAQKDGATLTAYAAKNGLKTIQVPTLIKENDFAVGNLEDARQLVKWAFGAKAGSVSEPFSIGDNFVVATLDKVEAEGTMDAAAARSGAEAQVRNQKKAAIIKTKLGANPTLESAAAAYNKQVMQAGADSSITMAGQLVPGIGVEPKLIGASFNKENKTKVSAPIDGTSGVYLIKVNSIQSKPADDRATAAQKLASRLTALRSQTTNWYDGLKNQATITDGRSKVF